MLLKTVINISIDRNVLYLINVLQFVNLFRTDTDENTYAYRLIAMKD